MNATVGTALIRPARPADGAALKKVHVETWRDAYPGILPDAYLVQRVGTGFRLGRDQFAADGRNGDHEHTLVTEIDEAVVGFASYGPARHVRDRRIGELYALYILPEFQGHGMGRSMVCVMLDRLFSAGKHAVDVEVLTANPARFFYQATGATLLGSGEHRFAGERLPVTYYRWQRQVRPD